MQVSLFRVDARAAQILDIGEDRWVGKLGSDSADKTLYITPQDGDHFLVLGAGECEARSYLLVGDDDDGLTLSRYREMAEDHVNGRRIKRGLSLHQ